MLAKRFCQKYYQNALTSIHKKRAQSLFEIAWSLTQGAQLTLTSLGRYKEGSAYTKHKIKSVDRLLGNELLQEELILIYKEIFDPLLYCLPKLYIVIDWSGCCGTNYYMLRATLLHDGRGITFYNEIHPQEKVGNHKVHKQFLSHLEKIISIDKEIIIITDGGFATPWFYEVHKRGWHFVGRINRNMKILLEGESSWLSSNALGKKATKQVKYIGTGRLGKKASYRVKGSVYTYKQRSKNRKDKSKYPTVNKSYSRLNKKAWVLVTSLPCEEYGGSQIKNIYKKRMQIEENFRDDKSPRYGLGWRFGGSKDKKRIAILCLIAALGNLFLCWIGMVGERLGLQRKFQSNSTRNRRVLSLTFLGKQIIFCKNIRFLANDFYESALLFALRYEEFIICH